MRIFHGHVDKKLITLCKMCNNIINFLIKSHIITMKTISAWTWLHLPHCTLYILAAHGARDASINKSKILICFISWMKTWKKQRITHRLRPAKALSRQKKKSEFQMDENTCSAECIFNGICSVAQSSHSHEHCVTYSSLMRNLFACILKWRHFLDEFVIQRLSVCVIVWRQILN